MSKLGGRPGRLAKGFSKYEFDIVNKLLPFPSKMNGTANTATACVFI